ncbi:MAG: hypothetical protein QMC80_06120 [Thermoplasmatales archaeon]|nr:hypothetical protein [Thermoplasmatales archaeon]
MRYVKISEAEMKKTRNVYDEVLSATASTLLFSVGHIIGKEIVKEIKGEKDFFKKVSETLKDRGWVKDIAFEKKKVSIVKPAEGNKCDRLKGIISAVYEAYYNHPVYCVRIKKGGTAFRIEFLEE